MSVLRRVSVTVLERDEGNAVRTTLDPSDRDDEDNIGLAKLDSSDHHDEENVVLPLLALFAPIACPRAAHQHCRPSDSRTSLEQS